MDKITITNLKIRCNHGVFEEEKKLGQNFYVTAELLMDTYPAGKNDDLTKSVSYAELSHDITRFMQSHTYDLIETVAHNLSSYILKYNECIRGVNLKISKPEAPIGLPFENVDITVNRSWHKVYIALGSNMGNTQEYIETAVNKLKEHPDIRVIKQSSLIVTKPYGGVEQSDFLNGVMEAETYLSPEALLDELHVIEQDAGRTREIHWGPRTLDLDIIMYDDWIINSERLTIPHCDMINRDFVLGPMNEIAPYVYHPVFHKTIKTLYEELNRK